MRNAGIAFSNGDFRGLSKYDKLMANFSRVELEYGIHQYVQLISISFLLRMRFDLAKVKDKCKAILQKDADGKPLVVETMEDGTKLYALMVNGQPDDYSENSINWLRNYFHDAKCVPTFDEINDMRASKFNAPPLELRNFNSRLPRRSSRSIGTDPFFLDEEDTAAVFADNVIDQSQGSDEAEE